MGSNLKTSLPFKTFIQFSHLAPELSEDPEYFENSIYYLHMPTTPSIHFPALQFTANTWGDYLIVIFIYLPLCFLFKLIL